MTSPAVCRRLKTKLLYLVGPARYDWARHSTTAAYWCSHTQRQVGPDDDQADPTTCRLGRPCFEPHPANE